MRTGDELNVKWTKNQSVERNHNRGETGKGFVLAGEWSALLFLLTISCS